MEILITAKKDAETSTLDPLFFIGQAYWVPLAGSFQVC